MKPGKIRVLIVEDHALVREGLRSLIGAEPDIEIAGEAPDADAAERAFAASGADVVLLDISLPGRGGIGLARKLRSLERPPRILFLSMHEEPEFVIQAFRTGAEGYALKSSHSGEVAAAIREVARGNRYVSPELRFVLLDERLGEGGSAGSGGVTDREKEVIRLVADGLSTKDVAERLGISHRTVESHRLNAMKKLGAKNTAELVKIAAATGIIS